MNKNDIADELFRKGGKVLGSASKSHAFTHLQKVYFLGDTTTRVSTHRNSAVAVIMYISSDKTKYYAFNPTAYFTELGDPTMITATATNGLDMISLIYTKADTILGNIVTLIPTRLIGECMKSGAPFRLSAPYNQEDFSLFRSPKNILLNFGLTDLPYFLQQGNETFN